MSLLFICSLQCLQQAVAKEALLAGAREALLECAVVRQKMVLKY